MALSNFPDLAVSWVKPGSLTFYGRRARIHTKAKLKKLRRLISEFGWTSPLIIDENSMVLCGAGRLTVALEDAIDLVPVIRIDHMTEAQKRAYILADNRIAAEASWDKALLREELSGLIELGYDVELTGFDTLEIDTMLSFDDVEASDDNVHLPDDDAAPIARVGDLWQIGKHRVLCGDARDLASYERLLQGERAQLIFTDPPYGCAISNNVSGLGRVKHEDFVMGAGEQSLPEFAQTLLRPAFRCMAANASPGAIAFVCSDWRAAPYLHDAAQGVFHEQKNLIVFVKTNAGLGTFFRSQHELIFAFKVNPGQHINNFGLGEGGRHRSNVWTYAGANTFRKGRMQDLADHSTVKPKALVSDAIRDCSKRGGIVLDSFLGSGTTLVSCEMTGRIGRGIELDPKYVDVILRRVSAETGCEPLLDGVTPLSAVIAERQSEGA
ncbi:DNA modification methylase [soil metagenome]